MAHPRSGPAPGFSWVDLESTTSPLSPPLADGFQWLTGLSYEDGVWELKKHGADGLAVLTLPIQPRDANARELRAHEERIRDENRRLEERGIYPIVALTVDHGLDEAAAVGRMGFHGIVIEGLDEVGVGDEIVAFLAHMIAAARKAAKNHELCLVLVASGAGGAALLDAYPALVLDGVVGAVVIDGVSYKRRDDGGAGTLVPDAAQEELARAVRLWRGAHPFLPLVAVDVPSTRTQSERAVRRARALGFHVSHIAFDDGFRTKVHHRRVLSRVD